MKNKTEQKPESDQASIANYLLTGKHVKVSHKVQSADFKMYKTP